MPHVWRSCHREHAAALAYERFACALACEPLEQAWDLDLRVSELDECRAVFPSTLGAKFKSTRGLLARFSGSVTQTIVARSERRASTDAPLRCREARSW
jgi:hypothetical protein